MFIRMFLINLKYLTAIINVTFFHIIFFHILIKNLNLK